MKQRYPNRRLLLDRMTLWDKSINHNPPPLIESHTPDSFSMNIHKANAPVQALSTALVPARKEEYRTTLTFPLFQISHENRRQWLLGK